jgi:elongation factor P
MISATKLRNGVTFEVSGKPYRVTQYQHTHLSRGSGTIKIKCTELTTGRLVSMTFKGNDKVEEIEVHKKPMQYLYRSGDEYVFMNPTSFEQMEVGAQVLDVDAAYLKEGEQVGVMFWGDEAIAVDLPSKMVFEVAEAAPGERGDSTSNVYKDAVLENGLKVRVPLFINVTDKVRIDTRDGSYLERVNE